MIDLTRLFRGAHRLSSRFTGEEKAGAAQEEQIPVIGFTDDGSAVCWPAPRQTTASHIALLGASGSGKTVMAAAALLDEYKEAIRSDRPLCLCVIDGKGDLVEAILQGLAANRPEGLNHREVRYLDPFSVDAPGFAFNLNKLRSASDRDVRAWQLANLTAAVSTGVGAQAHLGMGQRQLDVLSHLYGATLGIEHPEASPLLALDALTYPCGFEMLAALTTSIRARDFLRSARLSEELRASCASRIRTAFALVEQLEELSSAEGCIQFDQLLSPGIVLVDLGRPFGGLTSLQRFYGNVLSRLVFDHLLSRPSPYTTGPHVRVVLDEAHLLVGVLGDVLEVIYTTGRSRDISAIPITQSPMLIHEEAPNLLRVLLGNSPTLILGRLSAPDAELLSRSEAPRPGTDESFSTVRQRIAGLVANLPDRVFLRRAPGERQRFTAAPVDLARWQAAAKEHATEIDKVKAALCLSARRRRRTLLELAPPETKRKTRRQSSPTPGATGARSAEGGGSTPPPKPRSRWG